MKKMQMKYKKVKIDDNTKSVPSIQTFRPVTIIIDNNPNGYLQDGVLDISIKRMLPKNPYPKSTFKSKHILPKIV